MHLEGKIPFSAAFGYLKYEYALTARRFYGDAALDTVCIYDTVDPDLVLGLSLADVDNKVLFISDRMADELSKGNKFLKDAVRTAAQYCSIVAVSSEENKKAAETLLRRSDRAKIRIAEDPAVMAGVL